MRRNAPPPLSQSDLAAILRDEDRRAARPERVPVSRYFAESLGVGVGVAALVGGVLWIVQAPGDVWLNATATAGFLALGVGLVRRFWQPTDREGYIGRLRQFQRAAAAHEKRLHAAYAAIEALEAETAAERRQWEAALVELRNENKVLRSQILRYKESQRSPNYTPRANANAGTAGDAAKIVEHWFAAGEWWSRPQAERAGWSQARHAAAVELLQDAGVVAKNGRKPFVVDAYRTLDAALFALNKFCDEATTEPDLPRTQAVMSNDDDD
jgi:hypothetical protein